jgi:hypothetical protein
MPARRAGDGLRICDDGPTICVDDRDTCIAMANDAINSDTLPDLFLEVAVR